MRNALPLPPELTEEQRGEAARVKLRSAIDYDTDDVLGSLHKNLTSLRLYSALDGLVDLNHFHEDQRQQNKLLCHTPHLHGYLHPDTRDMEVMNKWSSSHSTSSHLQCPVSLKFAMQLMNGVLGFAVIGNGFKSRAGWKIMWMNHEWDALYIGRRKTSHKARQIRFEDIQTVDVHAQKPCIILTVTDHAITLSESVFQTIIHTVKSSLRQEHVDSKERDTSQSDSRRSR